MKTIKWTETFEFSKARASEFKITPQRYIKLFLVYLILFCSLGLFISVHGVIPTILGAVAMSLFFLAFEWVFNFLPKPVYVKEDGIGSGKSTFIPYKEIEMVVVGTIDLKGKAFTIMSITTLKNIQHIYGLSDKISPQELSRTLTELGVNVQ
jgi:hypothetical protein